MELGLTLNLFMARIMATNDTDFAMATDHLAGTANAADGCADFHLSRFVFCWAV